ncbi:MAG: glycosyltransferase family 4 protein [Deltaproteobacteria bacterium]|jgi:glycosyltransferase involved in cell wall biosynthesis|nr:glycosyltransferase family 4 protein [Deltaproteobacteria bacterium]
MKKKKIWATLHPFYEGGDVLGRKVANLGFIKALLRSDPFDEYHFFLDRPEACKNMEEVLREDFPALWEGGRFGLRLRGELPYRLAGERFFCFHLSDCFVLFTSLMQARSAYSRDIFPITAPTHSLSYSEYGRAFLQHLWAGVSGRDAVVATSRCGRDVVEGMYGSLRAAYALDAGSFPAPGVKIVPLGVEPGEFPSPGAKEKLGREKRARLGIAPFGEATVFLLFARLTYLSKMDLLPLLRVFKRAEGLGLRPGSYQLILAGWQEEGDAFSGEFKNLAANLGIRCSLVPRPDNDERKALFAAADVFLSPADNLQETFGLTILEAAVSGLPVIASDFDGYKDLVLPGQTGLLVPTLGPAATPDTDVRSSFTSAGEYHLRLAQQCVVEPAAMARAVAGLALDPALRRRLGEAARKRVLAEFSWKAIIKRYVALWEELAAKPLRPDEEERVRRAVHPAFPPYMEIFGDYFSARLGSSPASSGENSAENNGGQSRRVRWSRSGEAVYRGLDFPVIYQLLDAEIKLEQLKRLLFAARRPLPLEELRRQCPAPAHGQGARADRDFLLLWALKHDLLEFI